MNPLMKKALTIFLTVMPILAMLGTGAMWVDTRYMHKQIADIRYIDMQIRIVKGHIKDFERLKDSGSELTTADETSYSTNMTQLDHLLVERNRMLGLGS
jgi:hypothetical protein